MEKVDNEAEKAAVKTTIDKFLQSFTEKNIKLMKNTLLVIILLFFCGSCSNYSADKVQNDLDTYFSEQFSENEPGGAVLVMKGEIILFEKGYGIMDIETKEKITPETVFNTGSVTKTFVSNGVLILMQEGKLSLDDNIYKNFPGFKNADLAQQIKIVHLLSHTSGLIDSRDVNANKTFYLTANDEENFFPITQNDSLLFAPGERYQYSNPAFNGLALIIEKVSNTKWRKLIEERIFLPSKMFDSKITDGAFPQEGVAHGYIKENGVFKEYDYGEVPTFCAAGNGGVWSSVRDLANYELALSKSVFLDKETLEESRKVYTPENWNSKEAPGIGYSWFISEVDGLKHVGHTGSQGGFRCDYVSIPEKELFYVCLCNTPKDTRRFREEVLKILADNNVLN
ncbi:serine hydrolase domain-containing protein [candidate division KSB1 bacterium]